MTQFRQNRSLWLIALIVVCLAILVIASACSEKTKEPFRDAPQSGVRNSAPAVIIEMPDGFNNLAGKCDGPNYIYVPYHGDRAYAAVGTVKDDPRCIGNR